MEAFGLGIAGGLVASLIFLLVLSMIRPRLKISTQIAMVPAKSPSTAHEYRFKAINRSRRACLDVDILAYIVTTKTIPSEKEGKFGTHRYLKEIDLLRHQGAMVPGFRRRDPADKYAHLIRFEESAVKELQKVNPKGFILVRIVARDGWTGFPRMFEREFRLPTQIVPGTFASGNSLKIYPPAAS